MKAGIKSYKSAQERLNRYVRDHEMRPSKVRNMVLEQVLALPQPFTAEQLIETCAAEHISVGTVYNALNLFLDAHILHAYKRQEGQRATEYELIAAASNKIQMICKKCGRVQNVSATGITSAIKDHKFSNFNMQHFTLYVYGDCKICRIKTIGRLRG